jgi:hypothetical protein
MDFLNEQVSDVLLPINQNEYISAGVSLLLVLYASLAAPQLPDGIVKLFDNTFVKLIIFFLIVYIAKKDPNIALISTVAVMVTLQTLNKVDFNKQLSNIYSTIMYGKVEGMDEKSNPGTMLVEGDAISKIDEDTLNEIANETASCEKTMSYRNEFYPQYVNMKPDVYLARDTEQEPVAGFDVNAVYSSL